MKNLIIMIDELRRNLREWEKAKVGTVEITNDILGKMTLEIPELRKGEIKKKVEDSLVLLNNEINIFLGNIEREIEEDIEAIK